MNKAKFLAATWHSPLPWFFVNVLCCFAATLVLEMWLPHMARDLWMFYLGGYVTRFVPITRWYRIRRYRRWLQAQAAKSKASVYRGNVYTSDDHWEYIESRMP